MPSIHDTQSDSDGDKSRSAPMSLWVTAMGDGNPITTRVSESQEHSVHAAQIDDDDSHSSTSDDSEDDDHSRASRVDSQPMTASNQKSRIRHLIRGAADESRGAGQWASIVLNMLSEVCSYRLFACSLVRSLNVGLGSDPFDYEQKFPEDKRYEELGPMGQGMAYVPRRVRSI